ncbi:MAG: hypothetical protein R3C19_02145 [Planctomycetaceae bacterium]
MQTIRSLDLVRQFGADGFHESEPGRDAFGCFVIDASRLLQGRILLFREIRRLLFQICVIEPADDLIQRSRHSSFR